jgi:hypothetical protein
VPSLALCFRYLVGCLPIACLHFQFQQGKKSPFSQLPSRLAPLLCRLDLWSPATCRRCVNYLRHDSVVPIDAGFHADQQRVYQRLAGDGMRVLGFARGLVPARPTSEYVAKTLPPRGQSTGNT